MHLGLACVWACAVPRHAVLCCTFNAAVEGDGCEQQTKEEITKRAVWPTGASMAPCALTVDDACMPAHIPTDTGVRIPACNKTARHQRSSQQRQLDVPNSSYLYFHASSPYSQSQRTQEAGGGL